MANQNTIVRITGILNALGIANSSWYRKFVPASERKRPGPARKPIRPEIERLKQEEVYWRLYDNPYHAEQCLKEFHQRYNTIRPHWALIPETGGDPMTPYDVYVDGKTIQVPKWQGWARGAKAKLDAMMTEEAA